MDLEAVEMMVHASMHRAGAASLACLVQVPVPPPDRRTVSCACGQLAHYRELRSKPVHTVVGKVDVSRPYYLGIQGFQWVEGMRSSPPQLK